MSSYHISRRREHVPECPRSPSPFSKQMDHSEKQVKFEKPSSKQRAATTITPSHRSNVAPELTYPPLYSQYPPPYPPYQANYQSQYPYTFPHYPTNYPYSPHYPYPSHPAMMQYPPVEKGQGYLAMHHGKVKVKRQIDLSRTLRSFKLPSDSSLGRCDESLNPTRAPQVASLSGELCRVLRTGRGQKDLPVVKLTAPEFQGHTANFLVDPGSDVNVVKLHALRQEMLIECLNSIFITWNSML